MVQRQWLARTFGCCRVVFSDAIRCRDDAYRTGERPSPTEVRRRAITQARTREERAWLAEVAGVALVQSVRDADRAFRNWFDSIAQRRKGRGIGTPTFASRKDDRRSFRLTRNGFTLRPKGRLFLARIGDVFVVEVVPTPMSSVEREAGLDLGIARLATVATTDGERGDIPNPKHLSTKQRKPRRPEREKARRARGGKNRAKTRRKVAVQHGKVCRARRDHHHKQALALVRDNQAVHIEDVNITGMARNRRPARAIHDAGWGRFVRLPGEKAERHDRGVHKVFRWLPSSKTCSACGHVMGTMPPDIRSRTCPACDTSRDRDHNAAINILAAGRAERPNACGAGVSLPPREAVGDEAGTTHPA